MKRIVDGVYVGTVDDIEEVKRYGNFSILGACKEPLHRQNARISGSQQDGYTGRAMQKNEPEYLYAERNHALYCNLIDAPDMKYISDEIIDKCIEFIGLEREGGRNVLIVCNKAESRSPSVAFMWMIYNGGFHAGSFDIALEMFKNEFYEPYNPGKGMLDYTKHFWEMKENARK